MSIPHPSASLYVKNTRTMGRGVFAGRPFQRGEIIEICPVLVVTDLVEKACRGHALERYFFFWEGTDDAMVAVAFGYGSLYNHSPKWNASFKIRKRSLEIVFRAARDIAEGEQIFINYDWESGDYDFKSPV